MRRATLALLLTTAAALAAAPSASAGIWTPLSSGLSPTDTIKAIDYQSASRFWLATGSGRISTRQPDGTFAVRLSGVTTSFNDIAFKPGGSVGIAVGTNGNIWRSTDGGATWTRVNFTDFGENQDCGDDLRTAGNLPTFTNPAIALDAVAWGPGNRVFVTGAKSTVLRSVNDGASFTEINKTQIVEPGFPDFKQIACKQQGEYYDVIPLPTAAGTPSDALPIYFMIGEDVWFSTNGLTSTPAKRANLGCGGGFRNFVLDPFQPTHQWSSTSRGSNSACLFYTMDDANFNAFDIVNQGTAVVNESTHVAAAGGSPPTVVSVGKAGDILNSVDGTRFYFNRADGELAQQDWFADAGFDANNFAVGGAAGKLAITTAAATIPDLVAPAGTITGPAKVTVGQPASFTANVADNAGGSGINPASFAWSATGLPAAAGNPVSLTFPSAGFYTVRVQFTDVAGNAGEATYSVQASAPIVAAPLPKPLPGSPTTTTTTTTTPSATLTKRVTVAGGTVSLRVPRACIPVGSTFVARLSFKRSTRKGATFVKVSRVEFTVDGKRKTTDRRAPFTKKISVKALQAGSRHTLKARATIKVKRGKSPKKSISTSFTVCG
jgi:hypothetical protein